MPINTRSRMSSQYWDAPLLILLQDRNILQVLSPHALFPHTILHQDINIKPVCFCYWGGQGAQTQAIDLG